MCLAAGHKVQPTGESKQTDRSGRTRASHHWGHGSMSTTVIEEMMNTSTSLNTTTNLKDTQLFELLAGLSAPWGIDRVVVDAEDRCIAIWAGHPTGVIWRCPECVHTGPCRDHAAERLWRHLDCCSYQVYLHARIPRVACPKHGVRQVHVPWADPDSRFSRRFERFAYELLQTCTVTGCAVILGLTWDEARGIQQRLARRRMERKGVRTGHPPLPTESGQPAPEVLRRFSPTVTVGR